MHPASDHSLAFGRLLVFADLLVYPLAAAVCHACFTSVREGLATTRVPIADAAFARQEVTAPEKLSVEYNCLAQPIQAMLDCKPNYILLQLLCLWHVCKCNCAKLVTSKFVASENPGPCAVSHRTTAQKIDLPGTSTVFVTHGSCQEFSWQVCELQALSCCIVVHACCLWLLISFPGASSCIFSQVHTSALGMCRQSNWSEGCVGS